MITILSVFTTASNAKLPILQILLLCMIFSGCSATVKLSGSGRTVSSFDGYPLLTYELFSDDVELAQSTPRAILFYIQGSEYATVLNERTMHTLASAAIFGSRVVVVEKRGVMQDTVNLDTCYYYAEKDIRVQDHLQVMAAYLQGVDSSVPVIVMGGSEGGDIAAAVAAQEKRTTHLLLLGSGGGWNQEKELRTLVQREPGYLGVSGVEEYDSIISQIKERPHSTEMWAGHPFKRWSSYLFSPPVESLLTLDIPILMIHGEKDINVPVESARAVVEAFKQKGKENLTYREYADANHQFIRTSDGSTLFPVIEVDIVQWLQDQGILQQSEAQVFIKRVKGAHPEAFK
ncbi:MAG: alpha/beta hydrolase family protein [Candidatus Kapaibacterium sp.]